tara:strand:- start:857 stop:1303 length:447 start_codon:yes stop_codon:yes gene_type:complete
MPSQSPLRKPVSYQVVSHNASPPSSPSSSSSFLPFTSPLHPSFAHRKERDKYILLAGLAQMGRHLDVVVVEMFVGCCRDLFNKCSKAKLKLGCCGCAKPGWMIVCWQGRWVSEMGLGRSEALIFDLRWMKQRWDSRMTFWEMVKRGWG